MTKNICINRFFCFFDNKIIDIEIFLLLDVFMSIWLIFNHRIKKIYLHGNKKKDKNVNEWKNKEEINKLIYFLLTYLFTRLCFPKRARNTAFVSQLLLMMYEINWHYAIIIQIVSRIR